MPLPHPHELAALGAVLCLYRIQAGSELDGWSQAVRVSSDSALDSDGLCESLQFIDRDGLCCWRLYLLPDTDFLAWEHLLAACPCNARRNLDSAFASGCGVGLRGTWAGRCGGRMCSASTLHRLARGSPGNRCWRQACRGCRRVAPKSAGASCAAKGWRMPA